MRRLPGVIVVLLLISGGAGVAVLLLTGGDPERERVEEEQTPVVVTNLAGADLTLFRCGRSLRDTTRVAGVDGATVWLSPGAYMLRAAAGGEVSWYPVPIQGYRRGPDGEGTLQVTVRPPPAKRPPRPPSGPADFLYIPSGSILLGDRMNPREPHHVWITGYFIAPLEVTNGEFRGFLAAADGYADPANWTEEGLRWRETPTSQVSALLRPEDERYGRFGRDEQPVSWVTWYEANAFCRWLSRRHEGGRWWFGLPTDAEWEKAARGPDQLEYSLSASISDAEVGLYNWRKNPDAPEPVFGLAESRVLFAPNRYGLYHMTGNMAEWTQSRDRPYNRDLPYADDGRNHDAGADSRTVRGGSWYSAAISYLSISYRDAFQPEHCSQETGFRLVVRALP